MGEILCELVNLLLLQPQHVHYFNKCWPLVLVWQHLADSNPKLDTQNWWDRMATVIGATWQPFTPPDCLPLTSCKARFRPTPSELLESPTQSTVKHMFNKLITQQLLWLWNIIRRTGLNRGHFHRLIRAYENSWRVSTSCCRHFKNASCNVK